MFFPATNSHACATSGRTWCSTPRCSSQAWASGVVTSLGPTFLVVNYPRVVSGLVQPSDFSGLTLLIPFITGAITHLLSGMSHQVRHADTPKKQRVTFEIPRGFVSFYGKLIHEFGPCFASLCKFIV